MLCYVVLWEYLDQASLKVLLGRWKYLDQARLKVMVGSIMEIFGSG